jgi:hypothetical protein
LRGAETGGEAGCWSVPLEAFVGLEGHAGTSFTAFGHWFQFNCSGVDHVHALL